MEPITVVGIIAAILGNAAIFPQVMKSWKTKKTDDISLIMYIMFTTAVALWLIYGIAIRNFPIILSDSIGLALVLTVLYLKIRYG